MTKKILIWGALAFLIFFCSYRPETARDLVYGVGGGFVDIAQGLGDFFSSLTF